MSQKRQVVLYCDRCLEDHLADDTVRLSYDGNDYEIDVCRAHADMLDRDIRGWTRLAQVMRVPTKQPSGVGITDVERQEMARRPVASPPQRQAVIIKPQRKTGPAEAMIRVNVDTGWDVYDTVLSAISETTGWTLEPSFKRYKVQGPEGQVFDIPFSSPDWRTTHAVVRQLRTLGLDLPEPARVNARRQA